MRLSGLWERVNTLLHGQYRVRGGRTSAAHAAVIDSQSAKTTEVGGERGFHGNRKTKGRKRHILVDTRGLLMKVVVHPASLQDRQGGRLLMDAVKGQFPALTKIWAGQGYAGTFRTWASAALQLDLEVVYPWWRQLKRYVPEVLEAQGFDAKAFHVLLRRWVAERTFAWLGRIGRLSKSFGRLGETTAAWCSMAMTRLLLRLLTRS